MNTALPHAMRRDRTRRALPLLALLAAGAPALAAGPALYTYPDADLALGEQLIQANGCTACHARKVGGDGSAIYRPAGRIDDPAKLRGMVEYCSTQLNLKLFPDEVSSIAAVLQRDHYHFAAR